MTMQIEKEKRKRGCSRGRETRARSSIMKKSITTPWPTPEILSSVMDCLQQSQTGQIILILHYLAKEKQVTMQQLQSATFFYVNRQFSRVTKQPDMLIQVPPTTQTV